MQRRFLMDEIYISALGLSTPFFVSRRRDETVDREIYCSDCVSGRRGGGGEESCGSRCLVEEERGRIIKMRGNSIRVGEEKKNASMQMYERVLLLWPIRHLFWARIGYCFASPPFLLRFDKFERFLVYR